MDNESRPNRRSDRRLHNWCSCRLSLRTSKFHWRRRTPMNVTLTEVETALRTSLRLRQIDFSSKRESHILSGQERPRLAAAVSTIALPMVSEAVAAGEGTLRTCSTLPEGTNWKSST